MPTPTAPTTAAPVAPPAPPSNPTAAPGGGAPKMATLLNSSTGDRVAVPVGSSQAQSYFGKGYILETAPPTAGATPAAPTASASGLPNNPAPSQLPPPLAKTESSPGTYNANSLADFYNGQISSFRPQYETATKTITDANAAIAGLSNPDYSKVYGDDYTKSIAPIDSQIKDVSTQINGIDQNIASIEQDLRNQLGGQAPESIIKAEVARRSQPLIEQRQGLASQLQTLQGSRSDALSSLNTQVGLTEKSNSDTLALQQSRIDSAQKTVDAFNALAEKGAAATQQEVDNFKTMFSDLLSKAPDALSHLTPDEINGLRTGNLTPDLMQKIAQAASAATQASKVPNAQVINEDAMGNKTYGVWNPNTKQFDVIPGQGGSNGPTSTGSPVDNNSYTADQIFQAIQQQESGGNFNTKGASGENGSMQFMPGTWATISQQYAQANGINQSLAMTPANEKLVATWKIQQLLNSGMSAHDIALVWNGSLGGSEQPVVKSGTNSAGVAYDTGKYADSVLGNLQKIAGTAVPGTPLSDPGMETSARNYASGKLNPMPLSPNTSRSPKNANYVNTLIARIQQIQPDFNPATAVTQWNSAQDSTNRQALIAINRVLPNIDSIINISNGIDRGNYKPINGFLRSIGAANSNVQIANLGQAQKLIGDELGSALGSGGGSDLKTSLGLDTVDPNLSPEAFASNMNQLKTFLQNSKSSIRDSMGVYAPPDKLAAAASSSGQNGSNQTNGSGGSSTDISDLNFKL